MTSNENVQDLPSHGIFKGIVTGSARVRRGSDLEVRGIVDGDLFIEAGSRVRVSGIVKGRVVNDGADVELTGIIGR